MVKMNAVMCIQKNISVLFEKEQVSKPNMIKVFYFQAHKTQTGVDTMFFFLQTVFYKLRNFKTVFMLENKNQTSIRTKQHEM